MLSSLIKAAIRFRGAVIGLSLLLLIYGGWRLSQAGLDIFPEFSPKQVIIQTEAPGFTAEQVEIRITQVIENALGGLMGLKTLRSESIHSLSVVTAVFEPDIDIHRARQQVSERLAALAARLPQGTGPPLAVPMSSSSATILTLGLTSRQQDLLPLRDWVDWTLVPQLLAVPGVADVNVFGGGERQLQIQLDPEKLRQYRIGINEIVQTLETSLKRRGLGFIETANQRLQLTLTLDDSLQDKIGQLILRHDPGRSLTLNQIAKIAWGQAPPISAAQIGGQQGLVLMVIGQYGANTLTVSRAVEEVLNNLQPLLKKQQITLYPNLFRPADYIERSIRNLGGHLLLGALFVLIVLYAFLFDWRSAFISALAIPLSLLSAVLILLQAGVNLNIMVLGGLAIALGEVVDDAIIDTENIFRKLRENRLSSHPRPLAQIVLEASLEVRGSVVYASFIVALVFIPLLTLGGVAGRLFAPLGIAYILAILASLLVALIVTPALGYLLLGPSNRVHEPPLLQWLHPRYARLLNWIQQHFTLAWISTLFISLVAIGSMALLGGRFLPELREGHFIVHTASLPGTSLTSSLKIGKQLTQAFLQIPGVVSVSQWAGRAERGADTYGSHYSEYEVHLQALSGKEQQQVLERLRGILDRFPGIVYEANTFLKERIDETISGYTAPVVVNLYGPDLERLDQLARQTAALIQTIPAAREIRLRASSTLPQLEIFPDFQSLARWGVPLADLNRALATAYRGHQIGEIYRGNRAYPITLILPPSLRRQFPLFSQLPLTNRENQLVALNQLARIRQTQGHYNLLHQNAQRVQTVTCSLAGDWNYFISELKRKIINEIDFPPGYYPELTGAAIEQRKARRELILHSLLAGIGVLLLIYIALRSWRLTLLTIINLPFALVGGVAAVWAGGGMISVGSLVGFVTLFGITVRNAIMLMAHYRRLVVAGGQAWNIQTCILGASQRLPAILMTALVTALAMLPIAFNSDNPGREIMGPMAAIIIGGLFSSTALTLLLMPIVLLRWGQIHNGELQ